MSILDALEEFLDEQLAAEGITPQVLSAVDLSVEYSPVINFPGGGLADAVDVRPWGFYPADVLPDRFEVRDPAFTRSVGREELTIMRARYLLARDRAFEPVVRQFIEKLAAEVPGLVVVHYGCGDCGKGPLDCRCQAGEG